MASNEQVRIDLVADDKASKTIDKVADNVEDLEQADAEVTITADDDASRTIDKVADAAKDLDKADAEVTITADNKASADIATVRDDAAELARVDSEIVLKARVDAAKADLAALRGELKQTEESAQTTAKQLDRVDSGGGSGLRGNAIADLTGPLGEASGAASDFAGVFDGLGDIVEDTALKMGASSSTAGKIAGALGGLGVAVAAGAAAWSLWTDHQEKARKKTEETRAAYIKLQEAIDKGDIRSAAKDFLELNKAAYDAGRRIGATTEEITNFIDGVGKTSPKLTEMQTRLDAVNAELEKQGSVVTPLTEKLDREREAIEKQLGPLTKARQAHADNTDAYSDQEKAIDDTTDALSNQVRAWWTNTRAVDLEANAVADATNTQKDHADATEETTGTIAGFSRAMETAKQRTADVSAGLQALQGDLDIEQATLNFQTNFQAAIDKANTGVGLTSQEILDLKGDILSVADYANLNPVQVRALMAQVESGDMQGVLNQTQAELNKAENAVAIRTVLEQPSNWGVRTFAGSVQAASQVAPVPEIGTVNMILPAGWRGDPVRQAHATRRRTGRLFAR